MQMVSKIKVIIIAKQQQNNVSIFIYRPLPFSLPLLQHISLLPHETQNKAENVNEMWHYITYMILAMQII